jgi:hypothetical protein
MYKKCFDSLKNEEARSVIRTTDRACIPFDPANTDYAEYLKWLDAGGIVLAADAAPVAEGNTPLPADSVADEAISQ